MTVPPKSANLQPANEMRTSELLKAPRQSWGVWSLD
jgi:hypothetical protein